MYGLSRFFNIPRVESQINRSIHHLHASFFIIIKKNLPIKFLIRALNSLFLSLNSFSSQLKISQHNNLTCNCILYQHFWYQKNHNNRTYNPDPKFFIAKKIYVSIIINPTNCLPNITNKIGELIVKNTIKDSSHKCIKVRSAFGLFYGNINSCLLAKFVLLPFFAG